MAVRKKATKKVRSRKKVARKKTARKKAASNKSASEGSKKAAKSEPGGSEGFFILLDAPEPASANDDAIRLPADCRIDTVASLRDELTSALSGDRPLSIDAAALKRVDGAALQLLFAFARDAAEMGRTVDWKNVPDFLGRATASLGLTEHLPSG